MQQLGKEVQEKMIMVEAQKLKIKTEGKDFKQLADEIRDAQIMNKAKELGLDTENKQPKELLKEMMIKHPEEVKKLKLFPSYGQHFMFKKHHKIKRED